MQDYQLNFIQFALQRQVLRFGEFTLKSGRISPYFFNAGLFNDGLALAKLGRFYAAAVQTSGAQFDTLFGPAYKGIPLVAATAIALAEQYQINKPYCFNRKEAKDHGEGGQLVGATLQGRVLIIDDVITAGTAIRESIALIAQSGAQPGGIIVALDRQEKGPQGCSAIEEIEQSYAIPVYSIIRFADIVSFIAKQEENHAHYQALLEYRQKYGV